MGDEEVMGFLALQWHDECALARAYKTETDEQANVIEELRDLNRTTDDLSMMYTAASLYEIRYQETASCWPSFDSGAHSAVDPTLGSQSPCFETCYGERSRQRQ